MHPSRGGLSICHNFEAFDRLNALQILLKSTLEQSFIIMVYHDWVPLSVSLPPSPLPSFLFPPPFFWRGPTGFTRKHQTIAYSGNDAVDPAEKRGTQRRTQLSSPLVLGPTPFLRRIPFDLGSSKSQNEVS